MRPRLNLGVLDSLRGIAALYVMLGHAVAFLWAGPDTSPSAGATAHFVGYVVHSVLRWPHEAVLLFFLLSGFCIHYRQANRLITATAGDRHSVRSLLNLREYAQRRLKRLYPALLVALALTAAFDYLGTHLNPDSYGSLPFASKVAPTALDYGLPTLIGNLVMQASFVVRPFGSNGPLWSLAFESWFYLLYPILLFATARLGTWRMMAGIAVVSLIALGALPETTATPGESLAAYQVGSTPVWIGVLLMYWIVWAMGALVAEAYVGRIRIRGLRPLAFVSGAGLVVLMITLGQFVAPPGWWRFYDLAWGAASAVLLACLLLATPRMLIPSLERGSRSLARLGDISYSLYVVHLPWLVLVGAWWTSWHSQLPSGAELAVPGVLSTLALATGCWYVVERHFVSRREQPHTREAAPRTGHAPAVHAALRQI